MSVNRYQPHVLVIPEDRADEQIANGFIQHDRIQIRRIQILPCANGWPGVLEKFKVEYVRHLRMYPQAQVILLIDFDRQYKSRRQMFEDETPVDLRERVYVIGASDNPESLRDALGTNFESIGLALADECYRRISAMWAHKDLKHNEPDRLWLLESVRSTVFLL
ncbi:MAG: hypothetical protein KDA55_06045 [Planctomycetales bacterium]|nr:hypothetical protein [Planctomycetales bacterium]